jgi:hypothetical protein
MTVKRINAWSSPRNISTALMYSFAQRNDTTVVDEPLYAHFLHNGNPSVKHPGEVEILQSQEQDGNKVAQQVLLGSYSTPIVFFKQMTHHLVAIKEDFLHQMDHILLIRPPRAIINSYIKVIDRPGIDDIGVAKQWDLYQQLNAIDRLKAVVECEELLRNPANIIRQLCEALDISFDPNMLHWPAQARPEDGIWAPYWYQNVHHSTGFKPYQKKEYHLPDYGEQLAEECQPFYDALYEVALKVNE